MIETEGCVTRLYCATIQTRMMPHKGQGAVDRPANGGGYMLPLITNNMLD